MSDENMKKEPEADQGSIVYAQSERAFLYL